jgi:hypothetical protein
MRLWGKAALTALLGTTLVSGIAVKPSAAAPVPKVSIILDDVPLAFNAAPTVKNNVTMVPFRAIGEALGIVVEWDSKNKAVRAETVVDGVTKKVVLRLGQKTAEVNGQKVALLSAPMVVNENTLIPLRFFSTEFGAEVGWNGASQTVSIVSPKKKMHLRSFYALGSFQQRGKISSMDSVAFGWSRINENGEFTLEGGDYYWPEAAGEVTPESLVSGAAAEGIKPFLMVYAVDGNHQLTLMLKDETLRNRSIDSLAALVKDKGFGGVMLDFEGLGLKLDAASQQKLLNDYVRQLVDKISPLGATVSLAVPPPNGEYKGYDYKTLSTLAEDLMVMAYDYHPPGVKGPEPNAKVEEAIAMMVKAGVPKEKLLLGINLGSETSDSIDDKLGLAKRYGLKGAGIWLLKLYGQEDQAAVDRVVEKAGK